MGCTIKSAPTTSWSSCFVRLNGPPLERRAAVRPSESCCVPVKVSHTSPVQRASCHSSSHTPLSPSTKPGASQQTVNASSEGCPKTPWRLCRPPGVQKKSLGCVGGVSSRTRSCELWMDEASPAWLVAHWRARRTVVGARSRWPVSTVALIALADSRPVVVTTRKREAWPRAYTPHAAPSEVGDTCIARVLVPACATPLSIEVR